LKGLPQKGREGGIKMANTDEIDQILKEAADSILEDYRQMGNPLTLEQEARFNQFVAGLIDAEPPTAEQIWQTMEIAVEAIRAKHKEKALEAINMFMLEFISGVEQSSGAFQYLPMLNQAKESVKTGRFDNAGEMMVTFLSKCREAARSM
jgi:hypothetical protein